jgi:aubergine-like protein
MQSVATSASESIGRALEELKVEHIMRKEPVKRMGEAGAPNPFLTNYIRVKCKNKGIYQYVVHFDPPIESQRFRIKIVHRLKEILGPVQLFDGFTLFLPILLKEKITKLSTKYKELETQISIQLTKILPPEQIPPVVFNIIFKNIMKELKMTRIGQHYFSQAKQIDVPNHALQIWPGYVTAVHEFEDGLYLVLDVAHKVLRSQTCWHLMNDLHHTHSSNLSTFRQEVFNNIVGNIVLTKYNNRTYRVDDILWDSNPMTEFNFANGGKISYYEYYK